VTTIIFKKALVLSLLCSACCHLTKLEAQVLLADTTGLPVMEYGAPKSYEIGGVKVVGAQYSDASALTGIAGFKVGSKIKIPGPDLPRAIRALWKLRLFTDVQINKEKTVGDVIFLEIAVKERPSLSVYSFTGVKKSVHEDLNPIANRFLLKGAIVTDNNKTNAATGMEKYFREKGYLDAKVSVVETIDPKKVNSVKLNFVVERNKKVKIQDITFAGNDHATARKLRKQMDKTHRKLKIFSASKLVASEYEDDKKKILKYYATQGYRDAKIASDSVWREADGDLRLHLNVEEGKRYYFRNITWKGNSIYDPKVLDKVLGISKGDIYNTELLENRLRYSQDGRDVSTLYMDNGYLFFNIDPTEIAIVGDSIDVDMRIYEGPQATIDKVIIKGNDRTHEHVIRRELRTLPGEKFSRSDIIRSQREIINLGYFNQEALGINTPVNPQRGTVDIEYKVEEKPSDQLELSAGWGGYGVIGTLGVSFNNFSIRNIFKKSAWAPLPQGDGQRVSIRAQSNGKYFQSYNASFTEPWFGGKKPTSLSLSGAYTKYSGATTSNYLSILQTNIGVGTRLKWPDDNFVSNTSLDFQQTTINQYSYFPGLTDGTYNNFSLQQTFARNSINNPLFPEEGSKFQLTLHASPPYSLFQKNKSYQDLTTSEKFKWVEYFKWKFNAEWYTKVLGKMVMKLDAKIGALGFYNKEIGYSPFGRTSLGGDGLSNRQFGLTGRDILALRGYEEKDLPGNFSSDATSTTGGTAFAKYTMELRYPISLNPSSTIYLTTFAQGGNVWQDFKQFKPFDLRRTVGAGLRVFLPMFGTLGFDYGFGIDKPDVLANPNRKWTDFAKFSIVLGFEPE
jgi:outer membrane protein insertion porin family